ncbi:MAG TPA: Gfo/Idh/MocA family oxidoreductase [Anaerolineales bacterium]|nr:Gfo/Idh/MocA family oxidoreductase [Anaerolineales bacterium]
MTLNPVISTLGRKLRLAIIGGGPGSFIGPMHRQAARLDDRYEIVTGVLSSNSDISKKAALELGMSPDRLYLTVAEMLNTEVSRKDGIDVVAIMTPNDSHYEYSIAALERGFDVICDKPMTNTLEEAELLHKKVQETGLVFCLTHNYTGYPMVRQAKAMIQDGQLGTIRLIQVEYVQGGKADESKAMPEVMTWKYDPIRGGPSRVMGDIGTHAHNLTRFITGLEVEEVSAEIGAIVPGRLIDDFAGALLRFDNGARGSFWVTQAAAGVENCLRIRVSGSQGSLEWMQEFPQALTFKPLRGPSQNRTPNGPGTLPLSASSTRLVAGHPEGFPDGFANIYTDAAEAISARRAGKEANPLAMYFPNSWDGLLGVRFVNSVIESSNANGQWTKC